MERVYNFSAGPSMMPEAVLKRAADEMLNCNGSGMSVMEMSHRSKAFEEIINGAEATLRELLNIPDNYKVLFLQGGGSTQFAMIPLNLMKKKKIDICVTGQWAKKAAQEAEKYGVDGILLVSPYYNKATQKGLYRHFKTVARTRTTSTSARTTQYTERITQNCPKQATFLLLQTSRPVFVPSR